MLIVAKIGSTSLTDAEGEVDVSAVGHLCDQVASLRAQGHLVVIVTSGAVIAGLSALRAAGRLAGEGRPRDLQMLQAASAVGQSRLMGVYEAQLRQRSLVAGQVLLTFGDFVDRSRYLNARRTFSHLLDLGAVPIVNENDAVADEEIRFGDNDRLAALVANLLGADLLVLLTDTAGLLDYASHFDGEATLVEEVVEIDHEIENLAVDSGNGIGSGGMLSKLAAAKMASWSGVRVVIAAANRSEVLEDAVAMAPGVGTIVYPRPREQRIGARKLWIAFALGASGKVIVDAGAHAALVKNGGSLLAAGVLGVKGAFDAGDAVEIAGPDETVFAKGLVRIGVDSLRRWAGLRTAELPRDVPSEVVHRDDMVIMV